MARPSVIRGLTRRSKLREAGPAIVAARVADVLQHAAAVPEMKAVHDMRVATRRLRAALQLLKLDEAPVKRLQDALGAVRDLQLRFQWHGKRDERLFARCVSAAKRLVRDFPGCELMAAKPLRKGRLGGHRTQGLLEKRLQKLDRRVQAALEKPNATHMHAVRRSVKQVRYLAELAGGSQKLLTELEPLQQSLGDLHDLDERLKLDPRVKAERERLAKLVVAELERWLQ